MKYLFFILLSFPAFAIDQSIDLGFNKEHKSQFTIKISGDFPVHSMVLTGPTERTSDAPYYMGMMAYEVCQKEGRVPRELNSDIKSKEDKVDYYYDFKCEVRDEYKWKSMISYECSHWRKHSPENTHYPIVCERLETKFGKALVTCSHRDDKMNYGPFPY